MLLASAGQQITTQPFLSQEELLGLLKIIVAPEYQNHMKDWLYYAKPNEKKGLYILTKVVKHRGEKIFKTQAIHSKEEQFDLNRLTMDEAFKRYQEKKCQTSYADFYGASVDQKFKYNNILRYKEFAHLNYAVFVKRELLPYIQSWINIERSEQYKEYVLDFLRSFLATIRSNRKFVTKYSEDYKNSKPWDKFSCHSVFQERARINTFNPTIEELQEQLALEKKALIEKEKESGVVYNDQIANQEEIKRKKEELVNGQKNLLKGIYTNTMSTVYQNSYKGYPNKYPFSVKTDFSTSMVKGIVPDKYTMNSTKKEILISDELKNNVRTMLFK